MPSTYPSILESIQRAQASDERHWYLRIQDAKQTVVAPAFGPLTLCGADDVQT